VVKDWFDEFLMSIGDDPLLPAGFRKPKVRTAGRKRKGRRVDPAKYDPDLPERDRKLLVKLGFYDDPEAFMTADDEPDDDVKVDIDKSKRRGQSKEHVKCDFGDTFESWERMLESRERSVRVREDQVRMREFELDRRECDLIQRERAVAAKLSESLEKSMMSPHTSTVGRSGRRIVL